MEKIRDLSHISATNLTIDHQHYRSKRQTCKPPIFCNRNRFRTADGSCNNLRNPRWGKSFECVIRLLDPDYSDGLFDFLMMNIPFESIYFFAIKVFRNHVYLHQVIHYRMQECYPVEYIHKKMHKEILHIC